MAVSQAAIEAVGASNSTFFQLKNDKDFAKVRLMYDSIDALQQDLYVVHELERKVYLCQRPEPGTPLGECALCSNGTSQKLKGILRFYHEDTKATTIWVRTYNWIVNNVIPIIEMTINENPGIKVSDIVIRIQRSGAAGDMKTTYVLLPSVVKFEGELPEVPKYTFNVYNSNAPVGAPAASGYAPAAAPATAPSAPVAAPVVSNTGVPSDPTGIFRGI